MSHKQWTIRGLLQGLGVTGYELLNQQIGGLGNPDVAGVDSKFAGRDGSFGGFESALPRILTFPVGMSAPDELFDRAAREAHAWGLQKPWLSAWRYSSDDLELTLQVDNRFGVSGPVSVFGRPRVAALDDSGIAHGVVAGLAEFHALDPWFYGPARVDATDSVSPAVVVADGDVDTRRFTITVTGNGGTPSITHVQQGRTITWDSTLAGAAVVVLDFLTTTAETPAGFDVYPFAVDQWFTLSPGSNTITFTGCASVQVTHRGAHV